MTAIRVKDKEWGDYIIPVDNIAFVTSQRPDPNTGKQGTVIKLRRVAQTTYAALDAIRTVETIELVERLLQFAYSMPGIWHLDENGKPTLDQA